MQEKRNFRQENWKWCRYIHKLLLFWQVWHYLYILLKWKRLSGNLLSSNTFHYSSTTVVNVFGAPSIWQHNISTVLIFLLHLSFHFMKIIFILLWMMSIMHQSAVHCVWSTCLCFNFAKEKYILDRVISNYSELFALKLCGPISSSDRCLLLLKPKKVPLVSPPIIQTNKLNPSSPLQHFTRQIHSSSKASLIPLFLFFLWIDAIWQCKTFHGDGQYKDWQLLFPRNPIRRKWLYLFFIIEVPKEHSIQFCVSDRFSNFSLLYHCNFVS